MKIKNSSLNKAKKVKNDEFYTLYEDVENEVMLYKDQLIGKVVYLNCDNPKYSQFWAFFIDKFKTLGIKKLISTYYTGVETFYKTVYDGVNTKTYELNGNGSFDCSASIDILNNEADVVITNPPFSLFRSFVDLLINSNKDFLVIGSLNACTCKNIFKNIKSLKIKSGYSKIRKYQTKDGIVNIANTLWYTTLKSKEKPMLKLLNNKDKCSYSENYNILNADRLNHIPEDYYIVISVPITIFEKINYNQFTIIDNVGDLRVDGKMKYRRFLIKRT